MEKEETNHNYRYFKIIKPLDKVSCFSDLDYFKEGDIFKLSNNFFLKRIFNSNLYHRVMEWIEPWNITALDNSEPFDFIKYVNIQKPIVFRENVNLPLIFEGNDICYINDWLENKIEDNHPNIGWYNDTKTIKENNEYELSQLLDSEKGIYLGDIKALGEASFDDFLTSIVYGVKDTFNIFKTKGQTVRLVLPVNKGEKWYLSNPAVALALFNQDFIRLLASSEEILGTKKDEIISNENKDYIPNTTIKYYKVKDGIKITKEILFSDLKEINFASGLVNNYSKIIVYDFNNNNFNEDGTLKYFSIEFCNGIRDFLIQKELEKISICLSSDDAKIKLDEDIESKKQYDKEQEAIEFVKNNLNKYKKGTNKLLTPIEFLEQEQMKERKYLGKRLIKTLYKRIENLQDNG